MVRPALTVILGASRAGKTAWCIERLLAEEDGAVMVLPGVGHTASVRELLASQRPEGAGRVQSFADLARSFSDSSPVAPQAFRRAALVELVEETVAPGDFFGPMRGIPGFPSALGDLISELKLSGISPDRLAQAARTAAHAIRDPLFEQRAQEICRLYGAYEGLLKGAGMIDEDDLPVIAARRIESQNVRRIPSLVLVDGFYRLSRAWRGLLAALSAAGVKVFVTLACEPDRAGLFATPLRTLESLRAEFCTDERILAPESREADPLAALERGLFTPPASPLVFPELPVTVHDAPNPYAEAEMAARALIREHAHRGTPWNRCALVVRAPAEYAATLEGVFERYGVPLSLQEPCLLIERAPVKCLAALLRAWSLGWQREDVLAFLKSRFSGMARLQAEELRRRAQRDAVREGRAAWQRLAERLRQEERPAVPLETMLEWEDRCCAPPSASERVGALEGMAEAIGMWERAREDEVAPLKKAFEVATAVARARERFGQGDGEGLWERVRLAWLSAPGAARPCEDAVQAIEPYDSRRQPFDVVIVMGLVEHSFPARVTEDAFLRDDERAALRAAGADLESRLERADDERLLFYLSATAARRRLILSYPRAGLDGKERLTSFYLDEARAVLDGIPAETRRFGDVAPLPEEVVNEREEILTQCARVAEAAMAAEDRTQTWQQRLIRAAASMPHLAPLVEAAGLPPLPRLRQEELKQAYAQSRKLNVSELETYRTCPFQHFMRYRLNTFAEQEGAGPADRGRLYHAVLRSALRAAREDVKSRVGSPEWKAELLERLQQELDSLTVDARRHRRRLMERFLREALAAFAEREKVFTERINLIPARFELAFGIDPDSQQAVEREYDPRSTPEPLRIRSEDGSREVCLCGTIDRVDISPDGAQALVIDYKTGSAASMSDVESGEELQMPIYLLAVQELFGMQPIAACYDSARGRNRPRVYRSDCAGPGQLGFIPDLDQCGKEVRPLNSEQFSRMLEGACERVLHTAGMMTEADILPTPGKHCQFCDYLDCCRTTAPSMHDGEPFDVLTESA